MMPRIFWDAREPDRRGWYAIADEELTLAIKCDKIALALFLVEYAEEFKPLEMCSDRHIARVLQNWRHDYNDEISRDF